MAADLTLIMNGTPTAVYLGENTALAAMYAGQAAASEAVALAAAGPNYADTAAGLAATSIGDTFAVVVSGIVTIYRHDAGPVATALRILPTTAALAADTGSALVGWKRNATGATSRTVASVLSERTIRVTDFPGVDPTGVTDSYAGIMLAIDAGIADTAEVVFPQGQYLISQGIEIAVGRVHLRGENIAVLEADFDGGAMITFHDSTVYRYGGSVKNLWLIGNGSANQVGLHVRNWAHLDVDSLYLRQIAGYGVWLESDVFSVYRRIIYDRQNIGGTVFPTHAIYLDAGDQGPTTACAFEDCIIEEGSVWGIYLNDASNCIFTGGGVEGINGLVGTAKGIYIGPDCLRNGFTDFYCEQNPGGDFVVEGRYNYFTRCEAYFGTPGATTQYLFTATAVGNVVDKTGSFSSLGVALTTIEFESGSTGNYVKDSDFHKVTDAGTNNILENYTDAFNNKSRAMTRLCLKDLITAADDAAAATAGVPVGYGFTTAAGVVHRRMS